MDTRTSLQTLRRLAGIGGVVAGALFGTQAMAADFSATYSAGLSTYRIKGTEPSSGKHPVFIYTVGTTVRGSSESVAGRTCGALAYECLSGNGSGWIMVRDTAVGDLSADHCYQRAAGGCVGSADVLDTTWRNGSTNWGLKANLNWLAAFATP